MFTAPDDVPEPPPSPYYEREGDSTNEGGAPPSSTGHAALSYGEEDYEDIFYHFEDYAQDLLLDNAENLLDPQPAEHYEWEDHILDEASKPEVEAMKASLRFGAGCGLLGFGALRLRRGGGGGLFRALRAYSSSSRSGRGGGGYTFDALPPAHAAVAGRRPSPHGPPPASGSGLLLHATLSAAAGLGASLLAFESDAFYPPARSPARDGADAGAVAAEPPPEWVSPAIPLVPGRSVLADTLCPPLTREFRKFPKQLWRSGYLENNGVEGGDDRHLALYANSGWKGTPYYRDNDNAEVAFTEDRGAEGAGRYERLLLDHLQGFVINCERRSRHERRLRRGRTARHGAAAAAAAAPVLIPRGGVTADEDLELDDIYHVEDEEEAERREGAPFGL